MTRRYLFKKTTRQWPADAVQPASLVHSTDDEGDAYFYARLVLPDGASIDLSEGHHLPACEAVCERFNQAVQAAVKGQAL